MLFFLGGSTSLTHKQMDKSKNYNLASTIRYIGSRRILVFPIILTKSDIEGTRVSKRDLLIKIIGENEF